MLVSDRSPHAFIEDRRDALAKNLVNGLGDFTRGVRESDDSWKRPLYDGEENEYQRKAPIGKPSDWQVQQATKGAAVTDEALMAALNVL